MIRSNEDKKMKRIFWLWIGFLGVVLAVGAIVVGIVLKLEFSNKATLAREVAQLPAAVSATVGSVASSTESANIAIAEEINLDVPFTSQAPLANWDKTHEESCEEASILMAQRYFDKEKIVDAQDGENGLGKIIEYEKSTLGFFESTTADQTAKVASGLFNLKTEVVELKNFDQIKQYLSEGKLVIFPLAGRQIGNPFYKSPGPLYHMLLAKGYTKDKLITNDPGTKRGENYPYDYQTIANATHDWNGGDVEAGKKVVIVVYK
jgi:hypothetical protein